MRLWQVGTLRPLGGRDAQTPRGRDATVPGVGTCRPPEQSIEQSIEQTTGGGDKLVLEPDKTQTLETLAESLGLRRIDKLRTAGVTAADLKDVADQGHRDGVLVIRAMEWAKGRIETERRNIALANIHAEQFRQMDLDNARVKANNERSEVARTIIDEFGGVDDARVQAAHAAMKKLPNGKAYPIAVCSQVIAERLAPGELARRMGEVLQAPAAKPSDIPLWDYKP